MNTTRNLLFAAVAIAAAMLGLYTFIGSRPIHPIRGMTGPGPTDLVVGQVYEVADTFTCDSGDPTQQVREWHFGGADRSRRNQQTVDWYVDFSGRRVVRIEYRPDFFPTNGKKYIRIDNREEENRALEGFDANGDDDQLRRADFVVHNVRLEPQLVVWPCGPARD